MARGLHGGSVYSGAGSEMRHEADDMLLRALVRKEFQFHLSGLPLRMGMVLALVLAAASTLMAVRDYNLSLHVYRDRVAAHRRALSTRTVYSSLQPVAVRPPEPLSVLDQGFDTHLGSEVTIDLFTVPVEATSGDRGNEFLVSLPAADLTAIVVVILGLLALLLAHDSVQSEREGGTFSALLASGVPRGTLLAGKILGGLLTLALPLGGALLVGLAVLVLSLETELSRAQWLCAAALAVADLIYLSLLFLASLLISLSLRNRSRALSVSVLFWLVVILTLPTVARELAVDLSSAREARRTAEQHSVELLAARDRFLAEEFQRQPLRTAFSGNFAVSFASGENRAVRYRFGSAAYYDALSDYYRVETATGIRYAEAVFAERERAEERRDIPGQVAAVLAAVSPAVLLETVSAELAGTSITDYDRFLAACRSYRLAVIRYLGRKNAFASWRWFTDDAPYRLQPWPRFLGLSPDAVSPLEVRRLFERFGDPEIGGRLRRAQDLAEKDPARRLEIEDMPRFASPSAGLLERLRRGAPAALALFLLNGAVAFAVLVRFRGWSP